MPIVVVPACDCPRVLGILTRILHPTLVEPPDSVPLHRMIVARSLGLVPHVDAYVRERLPLAEDLVVENLNVMSSCDGDPILTRIDQDVVLHHDVSAAAIAGHDTAARIAWSASPDLVPDDLDGIVQSAAGLVDVDDILGVALPQDVQGQVVVDPIPTSGHLVGLGKLSPRERAMDVDASVTSHLDVPGIQGIDAGADGLEVILGQRDSFTRIDIDSFPLARSDLAVLDANPL